MPGKLHQKLLYQILDDLEKQGFHTIDMTGCIPDGIAVKDNEIYAIEVLTRNGNPKGKIDHFNFHIEQKEAKYRLQGYNGTIFKAKTKKEWQQEHPNEDIDIQQEYERDIERKKLKKLSASQIVQDFLDNGCKITK